MIQSSTESDVQTYCFLTYPPKYGRQGFVEFVEIGTITKVLLQAESIKMQSMPLYMIPLGGPSFMALVTFSAACLAAAG